MLVEISEQIGELREDVRQLLQQHHLEQRELHPRDSLSLRSEEERELVHRLVARFRELPEEERNEVPALLDNLGKLQMVVGDFDSAQQDFEEAARLSADASARAESFYHAYRAALERRSYEEALESLQEALKLDAKRFAPFPLDRYVPEKILGAGGFGVAFLCRHQFMDAPVVVKALFNEDLERPIDKVFAEAQALSELNHPSVIRIRDCGFVDVAQRERPYVAMDYFAGSTLEDHVKEHGPLVLDDLRSVARQIAEGLQASHENDILHRDVKPANVLVHREGDQWEVRIIDFGTGVETLDGAKHDVERGCDESHGCGQLHCGDSGLCRS